ncbi:unnamed protein product [Sphagnum balticum]
MNQRYAPKHESRRGEKGVSQVGDSYAIEYRSERILLGSTWPQIIDTLNRTIKDAQIRAAIKICLMDRLKSVLKISE